VLRQLNSIRRSVSRESLIGLVVSLVLTRLDYCNAVLAGLPASQLDRLQSAINAAARMIFRASRYDHVSSLLKELHWSRVPERIEFKLCALVYKCLNGTCAYLADSLHRVTDVKSRRRLRSSSSSSLIVPVTSRATLGDRAFPVVAARAWNALPGDGRGEERGGHIHARVVRPTSCCAHSRCIVGLHSYFVLLTFYLQQSAVKLCQRWCHIFMQISIMLG